MDMIGRAHESPVNGTRIAWGEMGAGPPLVLLHGLQDSHRTWRRVASLLAKHFRVLMPDLPGHGYSARPDAPYTLAWYAEMIAAWMDVVGVERAHICGHSFGGGIAQWMVLEERSRIDRLALVAAGGLGREVAIGMRLAAFPLLGRTLAPVVIRLGAPLALRFSADAFGNPEPEEIALVLRMTRVPGTDRAFQRSLAGVINVFGQYMQTIHRIHEVQSLPPLALFWGSADPVIPLHHAKSLLKQSTGITLATYSKCGHYPHLEATSAFAHDLIDFLHDPRPALPSIRAATLRRDRRAATRGADDPAQHQDVSGEHLEVARARARTQR